MADPKTSVIITAKDQTAAGLRSAENALQGFAGRFVSLTNPIALAGTALAAGSAALVASVKSAIDTGDQFNKLSQKTGIAVESLSALAYAGDLSGVSIDALAGGIKKLSVNMSDAAGSASGKAAEAFKALGIAVTDANGNLRSSEDVLKEVADSFANMKDGAGKTALAVALFGKAGADLIPLLNQGSKGLNELTEEAKALGLVMTGKTAKAAEEFNDNIRKLSLSTAALGRSITADLIGPLAEYTRLMVEARTQGAGFFSSLAVGLRTPDAAAPLDELRERAATLQGRISDATAPGGFNIKTRVEADRAELARLQRLIAERLKQANDFGPPVAAAGLADAPAIAGDGPPKKSGRAAKPTGSVDDYASRIQQDVSAAIGGSAAVKAAELADKIEYLDTLVFDYGLDLGVAASALDKLTGSTASAAKESGRLNELLAATPSAALEKTRTDMQLLAQALSDGLIDDEKFNEAAIAVNKLGEVVKETDTFANDLGLTFASAFEDAVIEGKKLSDVLQGLGRDIARMFLRKAVTEPLADAASGFFKDAFKGIFGGGKASGGAVDAGRLYLVGERGPELFAPGASGSIIPNKAMGGGSPVVVNIIEDPNRGGQVQQRNDGGQNVLDVFVDRVKSAIAGDIARGSGAVPAAMESTYGMNRAAGAF